MSKKIAINGFGRIGRLVARNILTKMPDIEIVAVNDLTSADNLAYLLEFDSTFRRFQYPVKAQGESLVVSTDQGDKTIQVLSQRDPALLPWKDLGVDMVIESTGFFTDYQGASKHLQAGSSKVLVSAPVKSDEQNPIPTVVLGVNEPDTSSQIISNASCTTNCLAPAVKVLQDSVGIKQAFGITAHAYTATQVLQDGPSRKDFRDGRAAAINAIPSSTGAAKAVFEVIPEIKGKISLSALRIPTVTGSMVYITAELEKPTSVEQINNLFKQAAEGPMKGILEYSDQDLVSSDIIGNPHSCIYDSKLTEMLGNTLKFVIWYDNEWGYANRLAELAKKMLG